MTSALEGVRVLVLSSAYEPIRIISWQRAMVLSFSEKIEILEHYPHPVSVRTVSRSFPVPAVVRMVRYFYPKRLRRTVRFTRQHVFVRDEYRCQYCQQEFPEGELTLDHVVPVVHGGLTSWSNIVTCCVDCNQRKGCKTPQEAGLKLHSVPREPQAGYLPDLIYYKSSSIPESWKPFVAHLQKIAV